MRSRWNCCCHPDKIRQSTYLFLKLPSNVSDMRLIISSHLILDDFRYCLSSSTLTNLWNIISITNYFDTWNKMEYLQKAVRIIRYTHHSLYHFIGNKTFHNRMKTKTQRNESETSWLIGSINIPTASSPVGPAEFGSAVIAGENAAHVTALKNRHI